MAKKDGYEVGNKKPPRSGQFRKGQSGNPGGKAKKTKPTESANEHLADVLVRVGNEEVEVGGKSMTLMELQIRQLLKKACQGDTAASRLLMQMHEKGRGVAEAERKQGRRGSTRAVHRVSGDLGSICKKAAGAFP